MFVLALDTQVNVALPEITRALNAPISQLQWVIIAYVLTGTALMTGCGRLADLTGRRRMWIAGLAVLAAGLLACGLTSSLAPLVAGRALQAAGMAMVTATGPALVTAASPPDRRGRALGLIAAGGSLGAAVGPLSGGVLVDVFGWQGVFLSRVPLALGAALLSAALLPRGAAARQSGAFDWQGAALAALVTTVLLLALNRGPVWGWSAAGTVGLMLAWPVLLWVMIWWERQSPTPAIDIGLFRTAAMLTAGGAALLSALASFGVWLLAPYLLVDGRGLSPVAAGWFLAIVPLTMAATAPLSGRVADRLGSRWPVVAGLGLEVLALALIAATGSSLTLLAVALMLLGAGLGIFAAPNQSIVMGAVPPSAYGAAGGLLGMMRSLGIVSGVAVLGAVYAAARPPGAAAAAFHEGAFRSAFLVAAVIASAALALHLLSWRALRPHPARGPRVPSET